MHHTQAGQAVQLLPHRADGQTGLSGQLAEVQPVGARPEQKAEQFRFHLRGKQVRQRVHNVWYYHTIVRLYQTKQRATGGVAEDFCRYRGNSLVDRGPGGSFMSPSGRQRGHGNGNGDTGAVLWERPVTGRQNAGL